MECAEEQKDAIRENGQSGNITTVEDKGKSKMNALTHGILAGCVTKYDTLDVKSIYEEFVSEFGADTTSRKILTQQLALTVLRLSRCARAETELLREALNPKVVDVKVVDILAIFEPTTETTVLSEGEPATLSMEALSKLALIYERYEPKLFARMLRLIAALNIKK